MPSYKKTSLKRKLREKEQAMERMKKK